MSQQKNQKQISTLEKSIEFVLKYKLIVSIASGSILVIAAIIAALFYFSASNIEKANRMYDSSLSYLNNINYITNESDKAKVYQEQMNNLSVLVQIYPKTVAATRARLFLGKAFFEEAFQSGKQDNLNMALSYYNSAYENTKTGFYKALALIGRGQCYEQKNDFKKAFDDYNQIVTKYFNEGFTPVALISMARSKEMSGDVTTAIEYYNRVLKEYPDSLWSRFAKGKIYFFSDSPGSTNTTKGTSVPFILQ